VDDEVLCNISESSDIPFLDVTVDNVTINALIDTGASVSVINSNFLKHVPSIKLQRSEPRRIRVANSQIITSENYARFKITLCGASFFINALFIDDFRFDLLLGMNALNSARAQLIINNTVVPLHSLNNIDSYNVVVNNHLLYARDEITIPPKSGMTIVCQIKNSLGNPLKVGETLLIEPIDSRHHAVVGRQMGVIGPNNTVCVLVTNPDKRSTFVMSGHVVATATKDFEVCKDIYGFDNLLDLDAPVRRSDRVVTSRAPGDEVPGSLSTTRANQRTPSPLSLSHGNTVQALDLLI